MVANVASTAPNRNAPVIARFSQTTSAVTYLGTRSASVNPDTAISERMC
jgi:hypothetical protein